MSYFSDNYKHITYPIGSEKGLRYSQIGAIHAISSFFTIKKEPAIVVMPTGSGKTVVMMMSAFVLNSSRILVITPSRLVRNQIAEEFKTLSTLLEIEVLTKKIDTPKVKEIEKKITSESQWEDLRNYDVVVVSPNSSSPGIEDIPHPPNDLFDLILVDEAHHSSARTWDDLLSSFPKAKKVLFTATPFRRDQRTLKGKLVYNYPISLAVQDGIFGEIEYLAVDDSGSEPEDVKIATSAETVFLEDRKNGFEHLLMVRTDSRKKAKELQKIYKEHTNLNLQLVHSGHSYSHIKGVIKKLKKQELDGVICVDMLGEGFDLPQLKIASIHSPHKSLAITLQFIGRFARTKGEKIGKAKFLAVPSTVKGTLERLYVEGADWKNLITELSESKIEEEVVTREVIEGFETPSQAEPDFENFSLYSLKPLLHVKVFQLNDDIELDCDLPSSFDVVFRTTNFDESVDIFITKDFYKPKWSLSEHFIGFEYNLFIVYFDKDSNLLFISSTNKNNIVYEVVAHCYSKSVAYPLSLDKVDKVLLNLDDFSFFNIGMRNNLLRSNAESYRIITGPSPHKSISRIDAKSFHRGHIYGSAKENGNNVTIGYSGSSKVWSNTYQRIPQLLLWCKQLAIKIKSDGKVTTSSPLDFVSVGHTINKIPENVIAVSWNERTYLKPPIVRDAKTGRDYQLLDFDLSIDEESSDKEKIRIVIENNDVSCKLDFSYKTEEFFGIFEDEDSSDIRILGGRDNHNLCEYINNNLLVFYCADFSSFMGQQFHQTGEIEYSPFDYENQIEVIAWDKENVDIKQEKETQIEGKISIFEYFKKTLPESGQEVIFIDDASGEIADFLTFGVIDEEVLIQFYHCKKAHGVGTTLKDAYDVCGQVLQSLIWVHNGKLYDQIVYRQRNTINSTFLKGEKTELQRILTKTKTYRTRYEIIIAQPGFHRSNIPDHIGNIIAGANDYIIRALCEPLKIIGSE